ncbi:MAG: transketolase [Bacteroidota bacterium]|nr:transketolase [Bacteroidota bacterium]
MSNQQINKASDNIRLLSMAMVEKAKSGHPGGAMGGADFINILYSEYLNYDPNNTEWFFRDRFFLDPGHMSPMLYSVLAFDGKYNIEDLKQFRQWGSITPGHPEKDIKHGVENTSGPLGQGHTMAVGAAIAERFFADRFGEWTAHKTYTFISDGGIQEEISQGAGRIAGYLGLSNLVMFYDSNDIQLSTETNAVISEDTAAKYEAWGWKTITIEGNNADEIRKALDMAVAETEKPFLIIGKTVMGKGLRTNDDTSFEKQVSTHGQPVSNAGASFDNSVKQLGGNVNEPFEIFEETKELYANAHKKKAVYVAAKIEEEKKWRSENPAKAKQFDAIIAGKNIELDFSAIAMKENIATRAASGTVLAHFANNVENMIVASADLANSDKTDAFLKNSKPFTTKDFSGAFFHAGVAELTMAAMCNGMALHGGIIPVCATFFVFSDYMKPAIRMAALQELPVKYVFTHDAFRVGEDGPTHQPIEQEAQIRLMEKLKNHSGKRSVLVLRPADAAETAVAWKMAYENIDTPTVLILSRQNIKNIPANGNDRYQDALQAEKGAYIVKKSEGTPDIVLIGNGSEVSTLFAGADMLQEKREIKIQIVSAISEGLFKEQSKEYKQEVIPQGVPVLGLTAGLPVALEGLVGYNGKVIGLDHFGYSAPANVLDEKFGYTAENIMKQIEDFLK